MQDENILYKYRSWHNPSHQRCLRNCEVYFAAPGSFNDPFDSLIEYEWDKVTRESVIELQLIQMRKQYPLRSEDIHRQLIENQLKFMDSFGPNGYLREHVLKQRKEDVLKMQQNVGILSLSAEKHNILLWSHYADNHKGFVIGFNVTALQKSINQNKSLYKVEYQVDYPKISPFGENSTMDPYEKNYTTKSIHWKYEREYRIVVHNFFNVETGDIKYESRPHTDSEKKEFKKRNLLPPNEQTFYGLGKKYTIKDRVMKFHPDCIVELIIGCEMPGKDLEEILLFMKGREEFSHVKIYQAVKSKKSFEVELERIIIE